MPLIVIIFSRDRAMQLDAVVRSFFHHAQEAGSVEIFIIFRTTSDMHAQQYKVLQKESQYCPNIHFVMEKNFYRDLILLLAENATLAYGVDLFPFIVKLHRRIRSWSGSFLQFVDRHYVLFLVDDNLFVRDFSLMDAVDGLEQHAQALGFSLRLGANITFSYSANLPQSQPVFRLLDGGRLIFDWTHGDLDFAYPLEVSSSIYRISDLLPLLLSLRFANPNQLESRLAASTSRFIGMPDLLCFEKSVTFCNPVNQVQRVFENRGSTEFHYSIDELASRFAAGEQIDIRAYDGWTPISCHQEVKLVFQQSGIGANLGVKVSAR